MTAPAATPWYRRLDGWFRVAVAAAVLVAAVPVATNWPALPAMAPAMALLLALLAVYGLVLAGVIRLIDRWHTLRTLPALTAVLWGGVIATAVAAFANTAVSGDLSRLFGTRAGEALSTTLGPPVIEETMKALGVVAALVVAGRRFAGPLEGLVLGALAGLGFQLVEDVSYIHNFALFDPNSDLAGGFRALGLRALLGIGGHWTWTALTGCAVGVLVTATRPRTRWLAVPPVLLAALLHGVNNGGGGVGIVVATVVSLFALGAAATLAGRVHWRQACHDLAIDPTPPPTGPASRPTTEDERLELRTRRTARSARRTVRASSGPAAAREHHRRQQDQLRRATDRVQARGL